MTKLASPANPYTTPPTSYTQEGPPTRCPNCGFDMPDSVHCAVCGVLLPLLEPQEMRHNATLLSRVPELFRTYHTTGEHSIMAIGPFDSNDGLTRFVNRGLLVDFSVQSYAVDMVTKQYGDSIHMI